MKTANRAIQQLENVYITSAFPIISNCFSADFAEIARSTVIMCKNDSVLINILENRGNIHENMQKALRLCVFSTSGSHGR